ncbi:hypothetical protein D9M68_638620 [compost metagenome]
MAQGGVHLHLGAVVDAGDRRMLEQAGAQLGRRDSLADGQVERMQVAGAHVDQAADVAVRAHHAAHLVRLHQAQLVAIAEALELFHVLGEAGQVTRPVGQVAVAPGQVAVDGEFLDALTDDLHRFQAHQLEGAHAVRADHRLELLDAVADAADQLPAVASTGAPADLPGFQQHHREAAASQLDRRIQPGETATDNAHIGHLLTCQRRVLDAPVGARCVIGGGVVFGMHRVANAGVHVRNPDFIVWKILRSCRIRRTPRQCQGVWTASTKSVGNQSGIGRFSDSFTSSMTM